MRRVSWCVALAALLLCPDPATAQNFTGTYTVKAPAGNTVTLVLRQDPGGKIEGELSGNETVVRIEGRLEGGNMVGTASSGGMTGFAAASLKGDSLQFMLADFGPDGAPNFATAQAIVLFRAGTAPPDPSPVTPSSQAAPLPPTRAVPAADQPLAQRLKGPAWCSFRYNQAAGRATTTGYASLPDGTVTSAATARAAGSTSLAAEA